MSVFARSALLLILSGLIFGCAESSREQASGDGNIRGINTLLDALNVNFLIEERSLGVLDYKAGSSAQRFDDLSYAFNFDVAVAGQATQRLASIEQKITKDMDYVFILAGSVATPEIFAWERTERIWADTETVFEMAFANFDTTLGPVDVYYAPSGTVPVLGNALGTIDYGERIDEIEFETAEYEMILTAPNSPLTVLYASTPFTNPAAFSNVNLILSGDPTRTAPVSVRQLLPTGDTFEIPDNRFAPTIQLVNAAFGSGAAVGSGSVDLVINNDFINPPAISNLPFGGVSADVAAPAGVPIFTFTAPGDMTPLLEVGTSIATGVRSMTVLYGAPGALERATLISDRRTIPTEARIRFTNASTNFPAMDLFLSPPDSLLAEFIAVARNLPSGGSTAFTGRTSDTFEITATLPFDETIIAGPVPIDLANGEIVEVIVLDTVDPAVVEFLIFSNLAGT